MTADEILLRRMHGLYLTRTCDDLVDLSTGLMGMHCWFHRNVVFSGLIRGADLMNWKTRLTKTWIHHALHGVADSELPDLLALHAPEGDLTALEEEVLRYMEDGVYSRAEFRRIFSRRYDHAMVEQAFSPWGGVFVGLARRGMVAFRDMTSRDFDLISAEPVRTKEEVLPELLRRYFTVYGPATADDAARFFGFWPEEAKVLKTIPLDGLGSFEHRKHTYYFAEETGMGDIPEVALLSGFDPYVVAYADREDVLPQQYKGRVVMKSGICLPMVAVNGRVAGIWNVKKGEPFLQFFEKQPGRIGNRAGEMVDNVCQRAKYYLGKGLR